MKLSSQKGGASAFFLKECTVIIYQHFLNATRYALNSTVTRFVKARSYIYIIKSGGVCLNSEYACLQWGRKPTAWPQVKRMCLYLLT